MKLVSGSLYWPKTFLSKEKLKFEYKPLEDDITCEYAIVGSGESGSLCAYFLSELGANVVLVDKRGIAEGSSSANTGLLQYLNDKSLTSFVHSFGIEIGVRHYQLCAEAIKGLEEITKNMDINPDFINRNSLYIASDIKGKEMLETEVQLLKKYNFKVELLTKSKLYEKFQISKELAIYSSQDAEVNPYKCSHGLINYASKRNVNVYTHTEVTSIIGTGEGVSLFTRNKKTIKAKKVIFAGGYESLEIKREKNAVLTSSFAIVTQPLFEHNAWCDNCLIWETARPYLYLRTTVDGRIIVGGLDEATTNFEKRESMLSHKKQQLIERLAELFPQYSHATADYYWAGTFAGTHSGLPMIRQYPEYPNCYFLMGYGGNGTVYSYILAKILKDIVTTGTHPDAHMYMND